MKISLNNKVKNFILLTLLLALFRMAGVASAAPSITGWSSSGGTTQNKDNDQDIMYLAQQGDAITFSITATGATSYKWFVNKVDQNNNADTFTWVVPNKKDIWEIRVEASDGYETVPKEWVISTLNNSEAPKFFEYFVDGKVSGRTDTDPWARPLTSWSGSQTTSKFYAEGGEISNTNTIIYGTWVYWTKWYGADVESTVGKHRYMFWKNLSIWIFRCF